MRDAEVILSIYAVILEEQQKNPLNVIPAGFKREPNLVGSRFPIKTFGNDRRRRFSAVHLGGLLHSSKAAFVMTRKQSFPDTLLYPSSAQ
ncbi:MAG: hypothetical protein EPO24_01980 [Bacteroidetes bacterium]|nr:MAG: hypothetical protein EPO24_01980 [Bacteroidota bacterium]